MPFLREAADADWTSKGLSHTPLYEASAIVACRSSDLAHARDGAQVLDGRTKGLYVHLDLGVQVLDHLQVLAEEETVMRCHLAARRLNELFVRAPRCIVDVAFASWNVADVSRIRGVAPKSVSFIPVAAGQPDSRDRSFDLRPPE